VASKHHSVFSSLARRTTEPPISWLMKMTLDHPHLISLAAGFTDNESLPLTETRRLLAGMLRAGPAARATLQYGTTVGDACLRSHTADRLLQLDKGSDPSPCATPSDPRRILIGNGSQQLLYMLSEALCDPGDIVLVEDPTYFVYLGIAQSHGLHCRGVRMDDEGMLLEHLDQTLGWLKRSGQLSKVKFLYLVTYFQNPSGTTTSLARKKGALELLRAYERHAGHPLYLVEDAAYRELRFAGEDVPSALSCDPARVLYVGTYSKPFATGIRAGFGCLPPALMKVLVRIKANHDFGTANLIQQVLARALTDGAYDRHLVRLRRRYAKKAGIMAQAIDDFFPRSVQWRRPTGGLYIWARLPQRARTGAASSLFKKVLGKDVLYVPGELCYANDASRQKPACEMRLSFGGAREAHIREGIRRLGKVLSSVLPD